MTSEPDAPLWGGRFGSDPSPELMALSRSLDFDRRLWEQDLTATAAHARSLARAGILTEDESQQVDSALRTARELFAAGTFEFSAADEDIHSAVERFLTAELGETGAKIHAGRSRNDLVVTELRMWLKTRIPAICRLLHGLQEALYAQARENEATVAPGYTHLQRAQPVLLAHHLCAHAFALARDFERLIASYRRTDVSCLGAAALAGTTLPLDARSTAEDLGFSRVFDNASDAVAARDFALEFLSAAAILGVNLSRLSEEIVLWTTAEFGFAALADSHATGSSIMPQKKNPDVAELARAKASRITGNLVHLLGVMKGLPLTYNRDLQEDKEPVFDTAETLLAVLGALRGTVRTINFDSGRLEAAAGESGATATDVAEAMVLAGVPFRHAHDAVGRMMAKGDPASMTAGQLAGIHPVLTPELVRRDARSSVESRTSHGGTAPERVAEQMARLEQILSDQETWLAGFAD